MNKTADVFFCKQFQVLQEENKMKVNTDAMLLGAWSSVEGRAKVLDVGTGTGIIALMLAQRNPSAIINGIEIDEVSASEAAENFKSSPWRDHLHCICSSIQDYSWKSDEKYNLIVCNPPFFSGGTLSLNENKNNVKHTIRLSHGDLLIAISRLINKGGNFDVILPYIEGERFIELSRIYNLFPLRISEVRSRNNMPIERLLISFSDKDIDVDRNTLILFEDGSDRTPTVQYRKLVSPFYLKF